VKLVSSLILFVAGIAIQYRLTMPKQDHERVQVVYYKPKNPKTVYVSRETEERH